MNKKFFVSATVAVVLMTGVSAMAADVGSVNSGFKTPGISLMNHDAKGRTKDVVLEPGTDPGILELHFAGAQKITFDSVGTLLIVKADGGIWRYQPSVYQIVDGKRKARNVEFHFIGKDRVSLKVTHLDPSAPVVVGPVNGPNGNS